MPEIHRTIDGYPLVRDSADFQIQLLIDQTLENCRALQPLYPTMGELFPILLKAPDRGEWLAPALKRLEWNLGENSQGAEWAAHFGPMLNLILDQTEDVAEPELLILARRCEFLRSKHCHAVAEKLSEFAWRLERKRGLSPGAVAQLRETLAAFPWPGASRQTMQRLAWTLFRAAANVDDGDPCWSAIVRRDLQAMSAKKRAAWLVVLDANQHGLQYFGASPPKALIAALKKLGKEELEEGLNRWCAALAEAERPYLSRAGLALVMRLIVICGISKEAAVDESLYAIARARWGADDNFEWVQDYLAALSARPKERAFACLEALMMNPVTAAFSDIAQLYDSYLSFSALEAEVEETPVRETNGVDGFPLRQEPSIAREQARIDHFLRQCDPTNREPSQASGFNLDGMGRLRDAIVQESAGKIPDLIHALVNRITWLAQRQKDFAERDLLFWRVELGRLLCSALGTAGDLELPVLIRALEADALGILGVSPASTLLSHCERHVKTHGWRVELVTAMKLWIKSLHGTVSAQDIRQKAGWLLWFEDVDRIDMVECWSSQIRAALRAMSGDERKHWLGALSLSCFHMAAKPPAKWLKPAKAAFAPIGAERFRERFVSWFQPFRESRPLKLTVPGRDILRLLMWYAALAEDSAVDEALSWFAQATWKNKDSAARAGKAETAFAHVLAQRSPELAIPAFERLIASGQAFGGSKIDAAYQELCQRRGKTPMPATPQSRPDPAEMQAKFLQKMTRSMPWSAGDKCTWDGDTLCVRGVRDSYRIDSVTGRIVRASDGRVLRLELPLEASHLAVLRPMLDGHDLRNPGQPNPYRAMMCAYFLTRDDEEADKIVVDES